MLPSDIKQLIILASFVLGAVFFAYVLTYNAPSSNVQLQLAQVLSPSNLAPNPDFESDPCVSGGGWFVAYSVPVSCGVAPFLWTTTAARSGTRSIKIDTPTLPAGASYARWLSNTASVSAQPGKTYEGSMWVKTQSAQGTTEVALNFWNGSTHLQTFSSSQSVVSTQDWTQVTVSGVAPAGSTNMRLELRRGGSGGQTLSGIVWGDDVVMQEASAAVQCRSLSFVAGSVTPSSVSPGGSYSVSCDYGATTDGINPIVGSGNCAFADFLGTAARFNCTAGQTAGTFSNSCTLSNLQPDNYCAATNAIGSLTVAVSSLADPGLPTNPDPADGASSVPVSKQLSWTAGSGATAHAVYFGTAIPPVYRVQQSSTTYDPGTLASDTAYYWRIAEDNGSAITVGPIWSFSTGNISLSPPPSDTTSPTVSITSPVSGTTVSGSVIVSASASDDVGVAGVQFFLDGTALGAEDTTAPHAVTWETTTAPNGPHSLTARARDAAGNQTTSAPVGVNVSNAVATTGVTHPNLLLNSAEIVDLRTVLGNPTGCTASAGPTYLRSSWASVCSSAPSGAAASHNYSNSIYTTNWNDRYQPELTDGRRITHSAITYAVTQNVEYARAVRAIILAWMNGTNAYSASIAGNHSHGVADMGYNGFILGYDLIYNSGVLSATEKTNIENWFKNFVAPTSGSKPHPWYPNGEGPSFYDSPLYTRSAYHNGYAWNNLLYAMVGAVTGDQIRFQWATNDIWPYTDFGSPYNRAPDYFTTYPGRNPRSLHEYIRGAIYNQGETTLSSKRTDSYYPDSCTGTTPATCTGTNQVMPNYANGPIPKGSMVDYYRRGPYPRDCPNNSCGTTGQGEGAGQGYQMFTLQPMMLHALLAWHKGENIGHETLGSHTMWDAFNFMRPVAAHTNIPKQDRIYTPLYEAVYSFWRRPEDLAFLQKTGDCADCGASTRTSATLYWVGNALPLLGYADRTAGTIPPSPTTDTTPPTASITNPAGGATVSGSVTITATASDNVGVTKVEFFSDLVKLGEDLIAPFSVVWNTLPASNGAHSLTAKVTDTSNNQTTSGAVSVNVSNAIVPAGGANIFQKRFVLLNTAFGDNAKTDTVLTVLQTMAANGYNGAYVSDAGGNCDDVATPSATCIANRDRVKTKAQQLGIVLIPTCCGGYEGQRVDKNLAEAYPIRGTEFRVSGSTASAITELSDTNHPNGGFESWTGNAPNQWSLSGVPGTAGTLWQKDTTTVHGGGAALKAANPGLNAPSGKEVRIYWKAHVKPLRMYRLEVWLKTSNWTGAESMYWEILGENWWNGPRFIYGPKDRRLTPYNPQEPTRDWTQYWVEFPSTEENYINITAYLNSNTTNGSLWIDDFKLYEIGLKNGVADSYRPVVVTSLDGNTTYTPGNDYTIPSMNGQTLNIPGGSKIMSGSTARVNWWRFANYTWDYSALSSFCRQGQFDAMAASLTRKINFWGVDVPAIMLAFDEMGAINWDPACGVMSSTISGQAGRYLAEKVIGPTEAMIKAMYPDKRIIIWNDMFDPYHNAKVVQYQASNGSFTTPVGSWEGIHDGTIISNWYNAGNTNNFKFWSGLDRTHNQPRRFTQIIGGFYDTNSLSIDTQWRDLLAQAEREGVTDVKGYLYQSYRNPQNFSKLAAVADMWKAAGRWGTGPAFPDTDTVVPPPPPPPPPASPLTLVSGPTASNITQTGATITWSLSANATGVVDYGLTSAYGQSTTPETSFNYSTHSQTLSNLTPNTLYHYRVRSTSQAGSSVTSPDASFTTTGSITPPPPPPLGDTTAPVLSGITTAGITTNSVTITWTTDEAATSQVEYGITLPGTLSSVDTVLKTTHSTTLSGLSPNTTYSYRVISRDAASNTATSLNRTFTTQPASVIDTTPPPPPPGGGGGGGGGGTVLDSTPPAQPRNLQIFGGPDQILLSWNNPTDTDYVRTIIVRKEGSSPISRTDGIRIYEGTAKEFTDTAAILGKTYYYALFSFDQNINYSSPAIASSYLGKNTEQEIIEQINKLAQPPPVIQGQPGIIITKYLAKGSRHPEVLTLQTYLKTLSFFQEKPTGFFGSITEKALKNYQTSKGIEPVGATGPKTRAALRGSSSPPAQTVSRAITRWLVLGSAGSDVQTLQTILKQKGYFPQEQSVTNYFGPITQGALRKFQCDKLQVCSGTPTTTGYGATGPRTRKQLGV